MFSERVYGIPPEQVIGSRCKLRYEPRGGNPTLFRLPEADLFDDGPGKPVGIQEMHRAASHRRLRQFGRRLRDAGLDDVRARTCAWGRSSITPTAIANGPMIATAHIGHLSRALDQAPRPRLADDRHEAGLAGDLPVSDGDPRGPVTPPVFSLTLGGPLHRLLQRLRVLPQEPHGLARVVPLFIAVTWLPLLALAVFAKLTGERLPPEFAAFGVHARLLLAVPLFLYAERALHRRTQRCLERFLEDRWAEDGANAVERVTATAARWRDSVTAEVVCLLLALLGSQVVVAGLADQLGLARGPLTETTWSPSKLWYRLVGLPAYQFLVYRWLWRWLVWARLLWGLSRLRLRPLATHPDQRGGLAFLAEPSVAFGYVVLGLSTVQAAIWADQMLFSEVELASFAAPLAVTLLGFELLTLGPLLCFVGPLWRAWFADIRDYDLLATDLARRFHQRWIVAGERKDLLGAPDISSLADLNAVRDVVRRMLPFPFGVREVVVVACR